VGVAISGRNYLNTIPPVDGSTMDRNNIPPVTDTCGTLTIPKLPSPSQLAKVPPTIILNLWDKLSSLAVRHRSLSSSLDSGTSYQWYVIPPDQTTAPSSRAQLRHL